MKIRSFKIFPALLLLLACFSFIACDKDDDALEPPPRASGELIVPDIPAEADGVLLAQQTLTKPLIADLPPISVDLVNAYFGNGSFKDAGELRVNTILLRKLDNNVYINADLEFNYRLNMGNRRPRWAAEGATIPAFNILSNKEMPGEIEPVEKPSSISRSSSFSFQLTKLPDHTELVICQIEDVNGQKIRKQSDSNTVEFTAEELGGLQAGRNSLLQVIAFNSELRTVGDLQFFLINQTADEYAVELQ